MEPNHQEALEVMERLKQKAEEMKANAVQLNLIGRHRDALQKISMAIEANPSYPDYHVLRLTNSKVENLLTEKADKCTCIFPITPQTRQRAQGHRTYEVGNT